jgi:hypothetical protein
LSFDEVLDERGQVRPAAVLVHDMPKVYVQNYRLPIDQAAAEIVGTQQALVRQRYPDTPTSLLVLFPRVVKNPRGTNARRSSVFGSHFRSWVDSIDRLLGPAGEPYDRSDITPYSFRHTYAQRHADAGTPVEVLAALMGHRQITTTQGYYRVTQKRKRKAVDLLAGLQVDHDGDRSRPTVERLLDSEHVRDAVGQVAVPFGVCTEPTNVKAHGQACPFRHQCFGCTRFRSDPGFLPELRSYLSHLLADRERLRAAAPELEPWARNQAIPAAEEIGAVRRIIDRCQALLDEVDEKERVDIDERWRCCAEGGHSSISRCPSGSSASPASGRRRCSPTCSGNRRPPMKPDRSEQMRDARRLDSDHKRALVSAAAEATAQRGGPLSIAGIARQAGVGRKFIYDHPDLKAEIELKALQATSSQASEMISAGRLSGASLRVDLENSRAQNHRLNAQLRALEKRLSQAEGARLVADDLLPDDMVAELADSKLAQRINVLEKQLFEAKDELCRTIEELEAARELMHRANQSRPEGS